MRPGFARPFPGLTPSRAGLLAQLEKNPFREPDFREAGASGRTYSVIVERDLIVTYWLDDAAKEIRVTQMEWV